MDIGERVVSFELPDHTGALWSLDNALVHGPVVLFFFPAANTPTCTTEACHFRDLAGDFAKLGASRVGISADAIDVQAKFANRQGFDYPLLSDRDGTVAKHFGVKRRGPLGLIAPVKRRTFVIGTDHIVLHTISDEWHGHVHADKALQYLRRLDESR